MLTKEENKPSIHTQVLKHYYHEYMTHPCKFNLTNSLTKIKYHIKVPKTTVTQGLNSNTQVQKLATRLQLQLTAERYDAENNFWRTMSSAVSDLI